MFDAFDTIRIINLPERLDRRAEMQRELIRAGLSTDPRVAFVDACRPDDAGTFSSIGARGCYFSHVAVLREAVATGSSVLIIEDDCDFAVHAQPYSLGAGWEIFYGGYMAAQPDNLHESDIVGSHMMGFSREGARRVLYYLENINGGAHHPPIDAAYIWYRRANQSAKTVFAVPPIGYQRPSRSDIEPGAFYNRIKGLRDAVEFVRRTRRRLKGWGSSR